MEIGIKYQNANFNPRPRKEGDVADGPLLQGVIIFQSTPS